MRLVLYISGCMQLFAWMATAQSVAGITQMADTSYNLRTVYSQAVKQHNNIQLVDWPPSSAIREQPDVVYCVTGGRPLRLHVFQPAVDIQNGTGIIIIHGGGWRSGNPGMHHALARALAARGYTCFTPEYRLSTEALYPAAVMDIKAAIRFVRGSAVDFGVDTGKLVLIGHSAGGELATFAGVTAGHPAFNASDCLPGLRDAVQAVVNIDGIVAFIHPESGEGDDSKRISAATYWFGYSKAEKPDLWRAASPLTYAGPASPPTLFINSAVPRMHAGRDDFMRILHSNNIRAEAFSFNNAPHTFCFFEPWFTPMVDRIHQFLAAVFQSSLPR